VRIRRYAAEQAHAIPARAYDARSIFAPSVTARGALVQDPEGIDDGGGLTPPGSTAQNGFREVKWFRCNTCDVIIRETHLDSHECE
jgi:hypothetical protein